jgi:excisionase family DNA binding protein
MTTVHRWLTTEEAAAYLSVHPVTLRRWVTEGKVPAHRMIGSRGLRFHTRELDEAMRPV